MYTCKKKLAIKDTGSRFGFFLLAYMLPFCSLPIPNQLRSGGNMSGISFKDTQTSRVGFGTAHRPCCSMRVPFSEALWGLRQSLFLSASHQSREKTPNNCYLVQQHQGCLSPGLWAYTLLMCRQTRLQMHSKYGTVLCWRVRLHVSYIMAGTR